MTKINNDTINMSESSRIHVGSNFICSRKRFPEQGSEWFEASDATNYCCSCSGFRMFFPYNGEFYVTFVFVSLNFNPQRRVL